MAKRTKKKAEEENEGVYASRSSSDSDKVVEQSVTGSNPVTPTTPETVVNPTVPPALTEEQQNQELLEKATNYETLIHICMVRKCIDVIIKELIKRAEDHDKSKMEEPELSLFVTHTPRLSAMTYGSEEYMKCLEELKPSLDHHYANNRHHPEHFKNGVKDMTIVDIIELLCDWKAASTRHSDGNLKKSIEHGKERFGMSKELLQILENSVYLFDDIKSV